MHALLVYLCISDNKKAADYQRLPSHFCRLRSNSTCYLAGTKATGAGVDVGRLSVDDRFDALHVGLECAVGAPMRVGNFDSKTDFLSANFTFCHLLHLLLGIIVTTIILTNPFLKCKCFFASLVVFLKYGGYNENTNSTRSKQAE